MKVQIIYSDNKPQYAVIPFDEWQALQDRLEDLEDIADAITLSARIASGEDETFSSKFVDRVLTRLK